MSSGGTRARSGPPPDPHALRRDRKDDAAGWTTLPAEGRPGDPPAWPLPVNPFEVLAEREADLWWALWRSPQALLWEQNGQRLQVAMHVRSFVEAELPNAKAALRTLVRQQADALLLTIPAMRAARVKIAVDEVAKKRTETKAKSAPPPSSRSRLRAVKGGAKRGRA